MFEVVTDFAALFRLEDRPQDIQGTLLSERHIADWSSDRNIKTFTRLPGERDADEPRCHWIWPGSNKLQRNSRLFCKPRSDRGQVLIARNRSIRALPLHWGGRLGAKLRGQSLKTELAK